MILTTVVPSHAQASQFVAMILDLNAAVQVRSLDGVLREGHIGTRLREGEQVAPTEGKATLSLVYDSGAVVLVRLVAKNPNYRVSVDSPAGETRSVWQKFKDGLFRVFSSEPSPGDAEYGAVDLAQVHARIPDQHYQDEKRDDTSVLPAGRQLLNDKKGVNAGARRRETGRAPAALQAATARTMESAPMGGNPEQGQSEPGNSHDMPKIGASEFNADRDKNETFVANSDPGVELGVTSNQYPPTNEVRGSALGDASEGGGTGEPDESTRGISGDVNEKEKQAILTPIDAYEDIPPPEPMLAKRLRSAADPSGDPGPGAPAGPPPPGPGRSGRLMFARLTASQWNVPIESLLDGKKSVGPLMVEISSRLSFRTALDLELMVETGGTALLERASPTNTEVLFTGKLTIPLKEDLERNEKLIAELDRTSHVDLFLAARSFEADKLLFLARDYYTRVLEILEARDTTTDLDSIRERLYRICILTGDLEAARSIHWQEPSPQPRR